MPTEGLCSTARFSWGQDAANANHSLPIYYLCFWAGGVLSKLSISAQLQFGPKNELKQRSSRPLKLSGCHILQETLVHREKKSSTNINKHQTMNQPINQFKSPRFAKSNQDVPREIKINPDLPCLPRLPTNRPHIGLVPAGRQVYRAPAAQTFQHFAAVLTVQLQNWQLDPPVAALDQPKTIKNPWITWVPWAICQVSLWYH